MNTSSIINYFISDFDKYISKRRSIIQDSRYLDEEYVPNEIRFRDTQKEMILYNIGEFINSNAGNNLFLYGSTGAGKTLIARFINKGINGLAIQRKLRLKVSYINCKLISSKDIDYYIFKRIYEDLTDINLKSGIRKQEIHENIYRYLESSDKKLIIILDEADFILNNNSSDLLYLLLRNYDINIYNRIKFVFVANSISFMNDVDQRVKSSLSSTLYIHFTPYNYYELKEILKERAKNALYENSISEENINYIAAKIAKNSGDARVGINILKMSAEIAASKNKERIDREDIDEAFENVELDIINSIIYSLNKNQRIILLSLLDRQISNKGEFVTFTELYEEYIKNIDKFGMKPLDKTTVYKNLKTIELVLGNLVETSVVSKGREGYKKIIKVIADEENLIKMDNKIRKEI
ncbi:ORC1-type DNA replication protein 1 [Nanobdella aerobiophila]|uniref:ORC1-type DNA replication protein n=1 Tax=Nanobdella aerobiophila TaxID=2586965 RepID=A0A915SHR1_9ARCH|nr:AAA family ATPase [Nanobdella aerobiophila]BBL45182.1 ORC1-type DNA replication protein 1 [Nanobdella aerobiophila]